MYGSGVGTLEVTLINDDTVSDPLWTLSGDQGNEWLQAAVDFSITDNMLNVRGLDFSVISYSDYNCINIKYHPYPFE